MLQVASALKGYAIEAKDGRIGSVSDFLFDDSTWKVRWLVVDTGSWLRGRKVLVHPSAIERADYGRQELAVALTTAQVKDSPDIFQDQPVSQRMENSLYDYYGWNPGWGGGMVGMGVSAIASPLSSRPYFGEAAVLDAERREAGPEEGDPHLRSMAAVTGYRVHTTDGEIGHVEDFMIDGVSWDVRYLIIDTRNWWVGQHVLMAPQAVRDIDWSDRHIQLDTTRDQVKAGPPWNPADMINEAFQQRLHGHYGWRNFGW